MDHIKYSIIATDWKAVRINILLADYPGWTPLHVWSTEGGECFRMTTTFTVLFIYSFMYQKLFDKQHFLVLVLKDIPLKLR